MKINNDIVTVLKSFSQINGSMWFEPGPYLSTCDMVKAMYAEVKMDIEGFDQGFGIFDLSQFLSVLSMFDNDVDLQIENNFMILSKGKVTVRYQLTSRKMIISPDNQPPEFESNLSFALNADQLQQVIKAASVMGSEHIRIYTEGGAVKVATYNKDTPKSSNYVLEPGSSDANVDVVVSIDLMRMLPDDYVVDVSDTAVTFKSENKFYMVSLEHI